MNVSKKRKDKKTEVEAPYKPTVTEQAVIKKFLRHGEANPVIPDLDVTVDPDGKLKLAIDHASQTTGMLLLMDALGIRYASVFNGLVQQLVNAVSLGREASAADVNFALKAVIAMEPRDEVEAMLAAQMVAVHQATMTFSCRLNNVETLQQQDSASKAFTKLSRTFAIQMEALRRYRTGGEQKVTVEHVTVNEGGQAIVGNVSHGGGGKQKRRRSTP